MPQPVPFSVKSNPPTVVEIKAANGKSYKLTLRLAIHGITDLQQLNPSNPNVPLLNFQISVITSTEAT